MPIGRTGRLGTLYEPNFDPARSNFLGANMPREEGIRSHVMNFNHLVHEVGSGFAMLPNKVFLDVIDFFVHAVDFVVQQLYILANLITLAASHVS